MSEQLQLTLPYEVIDTPIAARDQIRKKYSLGSKASYKIPFCEILLRPGSNHRRIFNNIPELAESLLAHGQNEPFELFVLKDGRCFLKEGERRYRAYQLLIEQEKFDPQSLVEFFPAKTDITEFTAMVQQYATNNYKDTFKPIENAGIAFDLKYNFGEEKTHEQIAEIMKISRQTVDNLIELAKLPDDLKDQIYKEQITATHALGIQRSKKKLEKQAAKAENEQAQSAMYQQPGYKDPLKDEMEGLEALDLQAQRHEQAEKENARKEAERLERDAVIVPVKKYLLTEHIGKRLAAPAYFLWLDESGKNDAGEKLVIPVKEIVFEQGKEITEALIDDLVHKKVETVFVFKEIQAAPSVITEPVAHEEKSRWDLDRPEMAQIINCIKLADKLETIVNKLDAPEGTKKDVADIVKWMQKDLDELRTWVHSNKKQNKRDR